jgi:hypothetical protein
MSSVSNYLLISKNLMPGIRGLLRFEHKRIVNEQPSF